MSPFLWSNYLTDLERRLNMQFERIDEANPDGIGSHYRYRFIKRADVQKVIALVNASAVANGHQPLNQLDVEAILKLYPDRGPRVTLLVIVSAQRLSWIVMVAQESAMTAG